MNDRAFALIDVVVSIKDSASGGYSLDWTDAGSIQFNKDQEFYNL
jgi:hypothetical protein